MHLHRLFSTFALGTFVTAALALGGCSGDDEAPGAGAAASDAGPGGAGGDASSGDGGGSSPNADGGQGTDAGSSGSTAGLIPTDGGAYFVAAIDGTPLALSLNLTANRSPASFSTIRGAAGLTAPTRDLEVRFPSAVGPAACDGTVMSIASLLLRTSDKGGLATGAAGTSCTFQVTGVSTAPGERVKGTFSGTVKSETGTTVTITEGAFDVPTLN